MGSQLYSYNCILCLKFLVSYTELLVWNLKLLLVSTGWMEKMFPSWNLTPNRILISVARRPMQNVIRMLMCMWRTYSFTDMKWHTTWGLCTIPAHTPQFVNCIWTEKPNLKLIPNHTKYFHKPSFSGFHFLSPFFFFEE